jgi:hypothetical protein
MGQLLYVFALLPQASLAGAMPPGLNGESVIVQAVGGVAVVLQRLDAGFPDELKAHTTDSDRQWLAERVLEHENVVEACLALGPVYPFGFGVMVQDREALAAYLEPLRSELAGFFGRVRDCREWGVKIRAIVDEPSRREQAAAAASGAAYLSARRERPLRLAEARRQIAARVAALSESWSALAREAMPLEPGDPAVIANLAFLVPEQRRDMFLAAIETSNVDDDAQDLDIAISGPWPAYSFRKKVCPVTS